MIDFATQSRMFKYVTKKDCGARLDAGWGKYETPLTFNIFVNDMGKFRSTKIRFTKRRITAEFKARQERGDTASECRMSRLSKKKAVGK